MEVDALQTLRPPRSTRPVPRVLRRLLPDPLRSSSDWERFTHEDLARLSPALRRAEAFRIRVALSLCPRPDDDVPDWILNRLARLEAA